MPPKPKFTKEAVAAIALAIIKEDGLAALTARELGKRLGTSASPIFTVFQSMDEVKLAARKLALDEFKEYISDYREYSPAFKRIGMMMVSYGLHEPELFKLLFMQEHGEKHDFRSTLNDFGGVAEVCIALIQRDYAMNPEEATLVMEQMWTQAFGLGAMCAMGVCDFTEEEISHRLGIMFISLAMAIKSGKLEMYDRFPAKNADGTFNEQAVGDLPQLP